MLHLLPVLAALLAAPAPVVPAAGPTPASFIPPGYQRLDDDLTTGDLNGDGRPDVVLALGPKAEDATPHDDDNDLPPRLLLVLWRTATGYQLAAQSRQALLCKSCGGAYGDPYAGTEIVKGVLLVHHYGGSSWRWTIDSKFRYQQGGFFLIGETNSDGRPVDQCPNSDYSAGYTYHDTNFVTGAYEVVRVSDTCQLLEHRRGRKKVLPLVPLAKYDPAP